jgi:translation elongation factor P/translation initiation factor 5A
MSDKNIYEARMAVFDYFVDTLVDLADPEDDDKELTIDDMIQVVNILFEGISMEVVSYDGETITFTAKV